MYAPSLNDHLRRSDMLLTENGWFLYRQRCEILIALQGIRGIPFLTFTVHLAQQIILGLLDYA